MKKNLVLINLLILLCVFISKSDAQESYGSFINEKDFFFNDTLTKEGIEGFTYGEGYLWGQTTRGNLVKIDTTDGTGVKWIKTALTTYNSGFNGAIDFDNDTIWVVYNNHIIPLDTNGIIIGDTITFTPDFLDLNSSGCCASRLIKENNKFWILDSWSDVICCIDRSGLVLKAFSNSWFGGSTFMLYDKYLIINSGLIPPSNDDDYEIVHALDTATGDIVYYWEYPDRYASNPSYLELRGMVYDGSYFWSIEEEWSPIGGFTVRKLRIPPLTKFPLFNHKHWGDFNIEDWEYSPRTGGAIEGIYGLCYNTSDSTLWVGEGVQNIAGYKNNETKTFSPLGEWRDAFCLPYDICFINDTMWILQEWGIHLIKQIILEEDGMIIHIREFSVGFDQLGGIATDGEFIWVSGRDSSATTGLPNNEIKKVDKLGNELDHFVYNDDNDHNYSDLTWYKNYLWAISSYYTLRAEIHKIDPNTGEVLNIYETGWVHMMGSNISGNLASDGEHLLLINGFDSTGISNKQSCFEDGHDFLFKLKLAPPAPPTHSSPPNNAINQPLSLSFKWYTSHTADSCSLQVDDNSDFSSPIFNQSGLTDTTQELTGLLNNTIYYWRVSATNLGGTGEWSEIWSYSTESINKINDLSDENLSLNTYPNPACDYVIIEFMLNKPDKVQISIYNLNGQLIRIISNNLQPSGLNRIIWDGKSISGIEISDGIYLLHFHSSNSSFVKKLDIIH